eukprot:CAMPEP_0184326678 /NCGR_PEP_ID=MMETSP1049-20130417/142688_1 /TAXON_ID=77928 /ORGANISM="Proteomonas sulcata, Strain CCMP704" /LENGTH=131 /DNA_ID=CAMNT_0026648881 /DNA_START=225 /DNA_END=620 /DNA_ORIENTATION=+
MTRVYFRDATAALVVFDVTRHPTLESVRVWKEDIDTKLKLPDGSKIPAVLLANKCDLAAAEGINEDTLNKLVDEEAFIGWFLTSAKDDKNINEAADLLVDKAIENFDRCKHLMSGSKPQGTVQIGATPETK